MYTYFFGVLLKIRETQGICEAVGTTKDVSRTIKDEGERS